MGFPIDSKVLGLREVIKVNEGEGYNIPIYQRPYSWEEKNIKDLKDIIMKLDSETLNNLIKNSTSKEDRFFYNELYNLSLQIKQQKLINEEKY